MVRDLACDSDYAADLVVIESLEVETIIGIYDWEKTTRQRVCLDIYMRWDITKAAVNDDINAALNYHAVAEDLRHFIEDSSFNLIEALAEACAQRILQRFAVPWLRLKLAKPDALPACTNVAVIIERALPPIN
ncbi:MAG: dihydroneopterin aldolase [Mariprofundales bacterium]